jgi:hypothetical protein
MQAAPRCPVAFLHGRKKDRIAKNKGIVNCPVKLSLKRCYILWGNSGNSLKFSGVDIF